MACVYCHSLWISLIHDIPCVGKKDAEADHLRHNGFEHLNIQPIVTIKNSASS